MDEYFKNISASMLQHECFAKYFVEMDILNGKNIFQISVDNPQIIIFVLTVTCLTLVVSKLIGLIIIAFALNGLYLKLFKHKPASHPDAKFTNVVALYSTVLHIFYCSGSEFPLTSYGEEIVLAILCVVYYNKIVLRTLVSLSIHLLLANLLMNRFLLIEFLRVSFILIFLLVKV